MTIEDQLTPYQKALVELNLDLAHHLALVAWRRSREEMEKYEVVGVAYQGLISAAITFDPSLVSPETLANGKAFAGFARLRINGAIMDWQRSRDHVPKRQRKAYKELQRAGWGSGKTIEQLAVELSLDPDKIREIIQSVETISVSLDAHYRFQNDDSRVGDHLEHPGNHNVEESVLALRLQSALNEKLDTLPWHYQAVFVLRRYQEMDFNSIAQELQLRVAQVRSIYHEVAEELHSVAEREAS